MSQPIDPADVLALIEDGPKSTKQLSKWLGVSRDELRTVLRQMRVDGTLRRLADNRVALPDHQTIHERHEAELQQPIPIEARPRPETRQEGPTIIRIINGVEYEVVSLDALQAAKAKYWPSRGGCSLDARR